MKLKAEKGVFATLVITPVTGGTQRIDGLEAIKDYLANLPAPTPSLGSKENPHDAGMPRHVLFGEPGVTLFRLHPRVLNDYSTPTDFRTEAARVFSQKVICTMVEIAGPVNRSVVENGKGQYYIKYTVPIQAVGWGKGGKVFINANDLLPIDGSGDEVMLYKRWKDAQLREAKCLTRKRIMKALAGPKDAKFKMGDRVRFTVPVYGDNSGIFVGYKAYDFALVLLNRDMVICSLDPAILTKEVN